MRRILTVIAILLLLTLPVSAFSGISSAQNTTIVASDGSCQVTLNLQLTLDDPEPDLTFPIPAGATQVTLNGSSASVTTSGNVRNVSLKGVAAGPGSYSLTIGYRLRDAIVPDEETETLNLTLELLSGFSYPIDRLDFTLELPGPVEEKPTFTSTYYPETIELMMALTQTGNRIQGKMEQRLQDHEKLVLILPVSEEMFPQPVAKRWSMDTLDMIMLGLGLAALVYWLIWLQCPPMRRIRRTTPPDGITAGEIGCRLTASGGDLTLMVLSWGQMGYLLIQPDDNGRVLLHKRMDMGNERDDFELKWFRRLFGKRAVVDATGYFYARLCSKAAKDKPGMRAFMKKGSGNPRLFRIIAAAVGALSGVSLAAAYAGGTGWQIPLVILLGCCGFFVAWWIQDMSRALHSRHRYPVLVGLGAFGIWFLVSFPAGEWNIALIQFPLQILAGVAARYGGRRSESGMVNAGEILGLREYLKKMDPEELRRNLDIDPQYYYDVAPYALALGVDRAFARKLQKLRLPECPYLTTGIDGHLTAQEWNQLLRDTVASMDALQARLPLDRLLRR